MESCKITMPRIWLILMALIISLPFLFPHTLCAYPKKTVEINMIENIPSNTTGTVLVFDCFGVVFEDKFKSFLQINKEALQRFVKTQDAPLKARELGFPAFYYHLAEQIDLNNITDQVFYNIFASASGHSPEVIKATFNDVNCLNKNLIKIISRLKEKGYKVVLIANADRAFLQKFLEVNVQNAEGISSNYQIVDDLFDLVRTSSDIRKNKHTPEMIKIISWSCPCKTGHLSLVNFP